MKLVILQEFGSIGSGMELMEWWKANGYGGLFIVDNCSPTEVLRCIHIGLLCVQDNPNNRPLMSKVVFMLENEATSLSTPRQPVYFAQRNSEAKETGENTTSSMNSMSLTVLEGR